ncbi:hypothetical protein YC2023_062521 [Brassica napus]
MKLSGDGDDFQGKKSSGSRFACLGFEVIQNNAVKNGYGFVGGLSVTELRRTRISMVLFRRRRGGGSQVKAVPNHICNPFSIFCSPWRRMVDNLFLTFLPMTLVSKVCGSCLSPCLLQFLSLQIE